MNNEVKKQFTVVWRIENFSFHEFMKEPFQYTSPKFTFFHNRECNLIFHPKSCFVTFTVKSCDSESDPLQIDYQLEIGTHTMKKEACLLVNKTDIKIEFKTIIYHTCNDWLTIKFSIWSIKQSILNVSRCFAHGGVEIDSFQLSWNLKTFGSWSETHRFFIFPGIGNFRINLHLSNGYIYVTIHLISNMKCIGNPFRTEIIVLGLEGRKWKSNPKIHEFKRINEAMEFPLLIAISDLTKGNFLDNNELSLCCNFSIPTQKFISKIKCYQSDEHVFHDKISFLDAFALNTDENVSAIKCEQQDDQDLNRSIGGQDVASISSVDTKLTTIVDNQCGNENLNIDLCEDLQRMYIDKKITDVVFKVGDKTLPAHKLVLGARSPVFMAMFEHDMLENKRGIIDVTDIDCNTFDLMLSFMYGVNLQDIIYENALKLLVASHKYQIVSLQEECSSILKTMINVDNICEIILYSDMVQDVELKECAVEYFKANAKCILQSVEWQQLLQNNIKLVTEVLTMHAMAM